MKAIQTEIPEVFIIEPAVFGDARGFFFESYNEKKFREITGVEANFVQDNHTRSGSNVVRGLHYQITNPQGKLVRVISGEIYDVVVDIRKNSPTFGKWVGATLSAENRRMLWVPPKFAHGFMVTADHAEVLYKTTDYWMPEHERAIRWDDAEIGINWPLSIEPVLSKKDAEAKTFREADFFE